MVCVHNAYLGQPIIMGFFNREALDTSLIGIFQRLREIEFSRERTPLLTLGGANFTRQ